jgi:hypothetical protein
MKKSKSRFFAEAKNKKERREELCLGEVRARAFGVRRLAGNRADKH